MITAVCDCCYQPIEIRYWYDRIIIHQCPKCKGGIIIILPQPEPESKVPNAVTA